MRRTVEIDEGQLHAFEYGEGWWSATRIPVLRDAYFFFISRNPYAW
jgi:hypothetical protein